MSVLKRISELPLLASVLATALVPVEQEGVTYSVAAGSLGAGTVSTPNVVVDDDLAAEANTLAIEANIQALMALGHGEMRLPPGVTWVAEGSLLATVCIQLGATVANLTIRGSGEGISTLKLKGSGASHVINIDGASNIKIFDLTVDGNRDNNTTTNYHGIRTGNSGVDGLTIERVTAQNTRGYGFGLQGGNKKRVRLINVTAANTGADGCDWKNISDDSEDIVIVGYSARNWGLDGSLTVQAGLDLRGPCQVMGVWTSGGSSDGFHVRVREGEIADASARDSVPARRLESTSPRTTSPSLAHRSAAASSITSWPESASPSPAQPPTARWTRTSRSTRQLSTRVSSAATRARRRATRTVSGLHARSWWAAARTQTSLAASLSKLRPPTAPSSASRASG
jgi:hypothetical protein